MARRIGLTGGIGSGKSTVLSMLAARGAAIVDADAISRGTTAAGGAAISAIAASFGAHFIAPDGAMDRERMRTHVYANPQARQQLETIVHPIIGQAITRQVDAALDRGAPCIVFDIPLLVESGRWRSQLDAVIVVDCDPQTQVARVVARSGLAPDAVLGIMAVQASRAQRLAAADIVIRNEALTLEQLESEVAQAAERFGL